MFLGDAAFVESMQAQAHPRRMSACAVLRSQRSAPATWLQFLAASRGQRNPALCAAYQSGQFSMTALAEGTGMSVTHVSRLIGLGESREDGPGKRET